ncbi:MAG: hypothetical protein GX174_01280, partial [Lentisphaerae bacterium]|nr:hypothetical protein [Lentisphaerota bacterium]
EADAKAVRKEWLLRATKTRETILFLREDDGIDVRKEFEEGSGVGTRCGRQGVSAKPTL